MIQIAIEEWKQLAYMYVSNLKEMVLMDDTNRHWRVKTIGSHKWKGENPAMPVAFNFSDILESYASYM